MTPPLRSVGVRKFLNQSPISLSSPSDDFFILSRTCILSYYFGRGGRADKIKLESSEKLLQKSSTRKRDTWYYSYMQARQWTEGITARRGDTIERQLEQLEEAGGGKGESGGGRGRGPLTGSHLHILVKLHQLRLPVQAQDVRHARSVGNRKLQGSVTVSVAGGRVGGRGKKERQWLARTCGGGGGGVGGGGCCHDSGDVSGSNRRGLVHSRENSFSG